jgi:Arc/MetJ family transcription regulator
MTIQKEKQRWGREKMQRGHKEMRITVNIDENLLREAMRCSGTRTKKEAVEGGLRALVGIRAQKGMRRLRGKVKWDGNLDVSRRGRISPARRSKASPLNVKGVKLGISTTELVAVVREGRERG